MLLAWISYKEFSCSGFQLLDVDPNDQEEDGANIDLDSQRKGKCAVIKTSTRQVRAMCPARCKEQLGITSVCYFMRLVASPVGM